MARAIPTAVILLAVATAAQAQSPNCYPRIGAYSGQYEGMCSDNKTKWTAVENTIGAYGRNCLDEVWTYNRTEGMFYNHRTSEKLSMRDCYEPSREQLANSMAISLGNGSIDRFHEGRTQPSGAVNSR